MSLLVAKKFLESLDAVEAGQFRRSLVGTVLIYHFNLVYLSSFLTPCLAAFGAPRFAFLVLITVFLIVADQLRLHHDILRIFLRARPLLLAGITVTRFGGSV